MSIHCRHSTLARKNISIGINTWNDLAALGRFGQTFDDIIRILLAEHEELKRLKGPNQPSTQQQVMSAAGKPGKPVIESDNLQSQLRIIDINLPGIEFPADRAEIIKIAEKANRPDRVDYLEKISNREYKNKSDLNNELLKDIKNINVNVNFRINTEPLRKEQYKEKKLEQERQPIIK
jgi:hypothetical protein